MMMLAHLGGFLEWGNFAEKEELLVVYWDPNP